MSRFDEVTAARPRNGGALALLGSRRFGPLFATQFLSAFNDNALKNALVEAGTFLAILFGTIAGMLIATGNGEISVAALIVAVALAAWGVSLAIPPIRPAASPARFEWNFAAITARAIGQATERPAP